MTGTDYNVSFDGAPERFNLTCILLKEFRIGLAIQGVVVLSFSLLDYGLLNYLTMTENPSSPKTGNYMSVGSPDPITYVLT